MGGLGDTKYISSLQFFFWEEGEEWFIGSSLQTLQNIKQIDIHTNNLKCLNTKVHNVSSMIVSLIVILAAPSLINLAKQINVLNH